MTGTLSSGEDITQRKLAEERIKRSKKLLQTIFDGISDPLIMTDADMRVRMLDRAALVYHGKEDYDKMIGSSCYSGIFDETSPAGTAPWSR